MVTVPGSNDIVPATRDVALGKGWFPLERYRGRSFRWVDNDAVVHVAVLEPVRTSLRLVIEAGPGADAAGLTLRASLTDGTLLAEAPIGGMRTVTLELPPDHPRVYSVVLHVDGGGKRNANDTRILNFRVFEMALERHVDVFPVWAKPAQGFHPLEHHAGTSFRWIANDAQLELGRAREDLVFDVESGPGLESKPFTLHVTRPDGTDVSTAQVSSRTTVCVRGEEIGQVDRLLLRVDGGGKMVAGDPRVMNFRVFAVGD